MKNLENNLKHRIRNLNAVFDIPPLLKIQLASLQTPM
jgi:hypothetical protein